MQSFNNLMLHKIASIKVENPVQLESTGTWVMGITFTDESGSEMSISAFSDDVENLAIGDSDE